MTWGWRLLALALFIIAMVVISKLLHGLIDNGYLWVVYLLIPVPIAISFYIDSRRARADRGG